MARRVLLAALGVLTASAAWAAGPIGSIEVGNWKGGAFTNDATGAFTHCAVGTSYKSGILFIVSVNAAGEWALGFIHPTWQLANRESIPIELAFDGRSPFSVLGTAINAKHVIVPMPLNSELVSQFRRAYRMTAVAKGHQFAFNLDTTSHVIPALANCVLQTRAGGSVAIKIPGSTPGRQAVAGRPDAASAEAVVSRELQIEAIELATNFILKTQFSNPKVLSRSETPAEFVSFGAAWRADEAVGAVKIIPARGDMKGIDVAAAVAAADSKGCQGKFMSGRVSELVDSDVVFRGFATCEDSDGARIAQHLIVPRKRGGFVLFSIVSSAKTEAQIFSREDKLVEFRKAALTAVGQ